MEAIIILASWINLSIQFINVRINPTAFLDNIV